MGTIDIDKEKNDGEKVIALAGNPNVGKSTLFNAMTGLDQHTGNWTGKTVSAAAGECRHKGEKYIFADLPGTYSLFAHSAEEEAARDYICYENPDAVAVVCDASCLERNLNLVLQTMEITPNVIVCINLMDEAEKKEISVDLKKLEEVLGVPVCGMSAREEKGITEFLDRIPEAMKEREYIPPVIYPEKIEETVSEISAEIKDKLGCKMSTRFAALRILDCDEAMKKSLSERTEIDFESEKIKKAVCGLNSCIGCKECSCCGDTKDIIVTEIIRRAEEIANSCVHMNNKEYYERDRKIDKVLTHRIWGVPVMAALLLVIFWITVAGANVPSELLYDGFGRLGEVLRKGLININAPEFVTGLLIDGLYRVLTWVISVMFPPMAIFFPMFTLLEDSGYLPRMAFNLDRYFKWSGACGKQALTMAMGLGCNAAGVTGCRIIDSPRERLIAMLTNVFVPCNGKYPTLIAMISIYFVGAAAGGTFISALAITAVIIIGVIITFLISKLLSATILKGEQSSFTLELPSYRRPQIGKVIVHSLLDRTIFVLGRAIVSAAPAGVIIWLLANINAGGESLLTVCANVLDPFGRFIGLDGTILIAFILGFPANEIVLPIMLTAYTCSGTITEYESLEALKVILTENGWTTLTAVCMIIFMMCHFPCATTCLTMKKETGSMKWTAAGVIIPTAAGIILCAVTANIGRLFL